MFNVNKLEVVICQTISGGTRGTMWRRVPARSNGGWHKVCMHTHTVKKTGRENSVLHVDYQVIWNMSRALFRDDQLTYCSIHQMSLCLHFHCQNVLFSIIPGSFVPTCFYFLSHCRFTEFFNYCIPPALVTGLSRDGTDFLQHSKEMISVSLSVVQPASPFAPSEG